MPRPEASQYTDATLGIARDKPPAEAQEATVRTGYSTLKKLVDAGFNTYSRPQDEGHYNAASQAPGGGIGKLGHF
jgi:hypothetical protein